MATLATENRVELQRLGIGVALAFVLHAAVAIALLNWGRTIFSTGPASAPFVVNVDLPPLVGVPASAPSEPPQAAAPPAERIIDNAPAASPRNSPEAGGGTSNRQSLESDSASPGPAVPAAPAPAVQTPQGAESGRTGGGGGAVFQAPPEAGRGGGAVETRPPDSNLMNTPLDTRITVMPDLYSKRPGGFGQQKKPGVVFRPQRRPGLVGQPEGAPRIVQPAHPQMLRPAAGATATNAVGARVQDRARAAMARTAARSALGAVAVPGNVGGAAINGSEGVTKNAIGMTVPIHPLAPGTNGTETKPGSFATAGSASANTMINGHAATRPGVAAGGIGGPARTTPGVLSGSSFHSRHP